MKTAIITLLVAMGLQCGAQQAPPKELIFKSYFDLGFGALIKVKVKLTRFRVNAKNWEDGKLVVYKGEDSKVGNSSDGLLVVFEDQETKHEFEKVAPFEKTVDVEVVGFESIRARGEPVPSLENLDEESRADFGWSATHVFIVRRLVVHE